ncbi:MAG: FoF1 ATP synthase subunit a [Candidatus Pelethousia sp.]|nr:FoF1 ATP synthase subunit a [Candidatus Pelethousia sp.]
MSKTILHTKGAKKFGKVLLVLALWLLSVQLVGLLPGAGGNEGFSVEISPERMNLFGYSISSTVIVTWLAMALVLVLAVLARLLVIPKMQDVPHGIQTILEVAVEGVGDYANSIVGKKISRSISPYLFSLSALMVACAAVELLGLRAPTADITMTFAMALCTFLAFNYYGIKEKGLGGRVRALASPTPLVFPIRIVCDLAVPVSMACRLFGNMLGGMVVMDLLYSGLGNAALGISGVVGLYFNAFHPLIQTFIFVTLTLSFISEAAGEAE